MSNDTTNDTTNDNPGTNPGRRAQHHLDMAFLEGANQLVAAMMDRSAEGMVGRQPRKDALKALRILVALAPFLDHDEGGLSEARARWLLPSP